MDGPSSEDRVLDSLADSVEDLVDKALGTNGKQTVFVVLLEHSNVLCPARVSFAN